MPPPGIFGEYEEGDPAREGSLTHEFNQFRQYFFEKYGIDPANVAAGGEGGAGPIEDREETTRRIAESEARDRARFDSMMKPPPMRTAPVGVMPRARR